VYQLPRPDERHTARDVGESSTPLIRRTVSGAASCATPRPRLIQPSPRPRRCTSSCLAVAASRVASRVTDSLRIRSHPAQRPVHGDPGRGRFGPRTTRPNHLNRRPPLLEIAPPSRADAPRRPDGHSSSRQPADERRTGYQWRYQGYGPPGARVGRYLRYGPRDVRAWFRSLHDGAA
jgi:hypothetical protein